MGNGPTLSLHDAEPGDIYVDSSDQLWRVVGICHQPTVIMERVEPLPGKPTCCAPNRMSGGVTGFMWNGFKRIYRRISAGVQ